MSTIHFDHEHSFPVGTRGGNEQHGTIEKPTSANDPLNLFNAANTTFSMTPMSMGLICL